MTDPPDVSAENRALQARPWLGAIADDFKRGIDEARQVAVLPRLVITIGVDREHSAAATSFEGFLGKFTPQPAAIHSLLKNDPEVRAEKEKLAKARLADLEAVPQFHAWLRWIRQAALVRAWASLEALAEDMWTGALNRAGRKIRTGAFSAVLKSKELHPSTNLSDAHVRLSVLAQFDFNLQDKIGTVLAERCSFKTVDGIARAFRTAFGWSSTDKTPSFPDPVPLRRVEWKRHAIVHRGGAIDEEYAGKAGLADDQIGAPLELDTDTVIDDINVIVFQGGMLLGGLALWLEGIEPVVTPGTQSKD